jgi:hypothetical protein
MNQYLNPYNTNDLEDWKTWYNLISKNNWPPVPTTVDNFNSLPDAVIREIADLDDQGWQRAKLFTANRVPVNMIPCVPTYIHNNSIPPKIILGGNSWAMGEWEDFRIVHKGLEQYFIDYGYDVINTSGPGFSNKRSIFNLTHLLAKNFNKNDIVLWVYGTPVVDLYPYDSLHDCIKQFNGVHNLIQKMADNNFLWLDSVAKEFDTVIHIIGASGVPDLIKNYKNLIPVVQSWPALLVGPSDIAKNIESAEGWYSEDIVQWHRFPKILAMQVIDEIYNIIANHEKICKNNPIFTDRMHPSREGHKILFDYLIKELNL